MYTFHQKWTFCILGQIFRQIVSIRVMTLINTNVVASRHIKREEVLLPVAVRHSKTPEFKLTMSRYCACTAMIDSGSLLANRNRQKRRRATMRILHDFEVFAGYSGVLENKFCLGCDFLCKE